MSLLGQTERARQVFVGDADPLPDALESFSAWILRKTEAKQIAVWGNGAAFDNVILAAAYSRQRMQCPWRRPNDRCYRTLKALHPEIEFERVGEHHNAIDDAVSQARHALKILQR